jgi:hypothetical protein
VEGNANFVAKEETKNNDVVLLANKENGPEKKNVWYLDTGASNNMCGYKYMFTKLKEIADGHVSFGDSSKVCVESEGNILIMLKDRTQKFILNIYEQLLERDYTIFMKDRTLYLRDKSNQLIAQVEMTTNRMFKLNLMNIEVTCLKICVGEKDWL